MSTLSLNEIKAIVKELLERYHAEYALLFGSYARGDATPDSDIDIIVVGGKNFVPRNIFALAEVLGVDGFCDRLLKLAAHAREGHGLVLHQAAFVEELLALRAQTPCDGKLVCNG